MAFQIVIEPDGEDGVMISFKGALTEATELQDYVIPPGKKLSFDLADLKSINSIGIRQFINFMERLKDRPEMFFHRCTKPFVDQINLVHHFLPTTARVKSFYVPYYDPNGDEEKQVLLIESIAYFLLDGQVTLKLPEVLSREGHVMELDVSPDRYFQFLRFHG